MPVNAQSRPGLIETRAVDEARPLRVVCMGAGISGILATIRLPQRIPNIDLQVYEKNAEIGGTWFENRYPGCACDIPAHTYQLTFEPNLEWKQFYAPGEEILQYWQRVVEKYDCMKYIKLKHEVIHARWNEERSEWQLKIRDLATGSVFEDSCNILLSAVGGLNKWEWPTIPGLHNFKGKLMHSACWDRSYDYTGDKVAVIGNGSGGIQIVPAMLPQVEHIDHYVRGKTWIAPTFAKQKVDERGADMDNFSFTEEDFRSFKNDKGTYEKFRKDVELELQSCHAFTLRDTKEQIMAREGFAQNMKKRLSRKPELADQLIPSFPPCSRRLTPGPGYLEALTDDSVQLIRAGIAEIVEDGIVTVDGKRRPVDTIVCATGYDCSYIPRFPVIGEDGILLASRWKETPESYLSIATSGFPNYFLSLGPNSSLGAGNLLIVIEKYVEYITECVAKMQRDNIKSMVPRRDAVKRFSSHCDEYFKGTVFTVKCRSWYKGGTEDGRVNALWPGSSLHAIKTLSNPRWEDFQYEYVNDNPNGWLGDGWSQDEKDENIKIDYLDDDAINFPRPPERIARDRSREKLLSNNGCR